MAQAVDRSKSLIKSRLRSFVGVLACAGLALVSSRPSEAQSAFTVLHAFGPTTQRPGTMMRASDGKFYGTTDQGGANNKGVIFRHDASGSTVTVHSFDGTHGQGAAGAMVQAADGLLYGTTSSGGANNNTGVLFRFNPSTSVFTVVHDFGGATDGAFPRGRLIVGADGALYGTTASISPDYYGTIFRFDPVTMAFATLDHFDAQNGGWGPADGVIQGTDGALYGMLGPATDDELGALYRYDLSSGILTVLHRFEGGPTNYPSRGLLQGADGALYGFLTSGGVDGAGAIFRYDLTTSTSAILHSFKGSSPAFPLALFQGTDGALYGTTLQDGRGFSGRVFRFDLASATLITLHDFFETDGRNPVSLIQAPNGLLYGTAQLGGSGGGVLFRLSTLPRSGDLVITKTNGRTTVDAGTRLSYTITVENQGPDPILGATVTDVLPATLSAASWTWSSATGGAQAIIRRVGSTNEMTVDLPVDASLTYTLGTTLSHDARGTVSNTASVTLASDMTDPDLDNNTATDTDAVNAFSDLTIQKTDGQVTAGTGQPVFYTITVANLGPHGVTGATVTDTLPDTLIGATWTCTATAGAGCTASGSGGIADTVVDLPVGASATYSLTATLSGSATGSLSNTASVAVPDGFTDSVLGNNTETDTDTVVDQTAPAVTVVAPRGGEIVLSGSAYLIEWTASDNVSLASFDVALSRDGGATFPPIAGCTDLPGSARSCLWARPAPASAQALVRVTARDSSGNSGTDVTDSSLRIGSGTGSITLTRPVRAEHWRRGTTQTIRWNHNLRAGSAVDIEISRDGGATWTVVAESVANQTATTGRCDWLVTGPATTVARVRVSWAGNADVKDVSDGHFAIDEPAVTVIAPNTAVSWKVGQTHRVRWNHNLGTAESVNIAISRDGGGTWTPLVSNRPNTAVATGYYDWVVTGPPTTQARIRVSWSGDTSISDVSNADFTIRP